MMFDHAMVSSQFVSLYGRLVAFFVTILWCGFYYLDTCQRLHSPTKIVMMWLAYGDGSGYAKTPKT